MNLVFLYENILLKFSYRLIYLTDWFQIELIFHGPKRIAYSNHFFFHCSPLNIALGRNHLHLYDIAFLLKLSPWNSNFLFRLPVKRVCSSFSCGSLGSESLSSTESSESLCSEGPSKFMWSISSCSEMLAFLIFFSFSFNIFLKFLCWANVLDIKHIMVIYGAKSCRVRNIYTKKRRLKK